LNTAYLSFHSVAKRKLRQCSGSVIPLVSLIAHLLLFHQAGDSFADTPTQSPLGLPNAEVERLVESLEHSRTDAYGGVHYQIMQNFRNSNDETSLNQISFWSKNNQFFRIDIDHYASDDSKNVQSRERLIVRPEGFASLRAEGDSDQFAVVTFGNVVEGMDRLLGMPTVHAGTRAFSILTPEDLLKDKYEDGAVRSLISNHFENGLLRWDSNYVSGSTKITCQVTCDVGKGVCTQYSAQTFKNQEVASDVSVNRTFQFGTHRSIPIRETIEVSRPGQATEIDRRDTILVDWTPVDLKVFELSGLTNRAANGSPWARRLTVLLVGISMLIGWRFFRKRRHTTVIPRVFFLVSIGPWYMVTPSTLAADLDSIAAALAAAENPYNNCQIEWTESKVNSAGEENQTAKCLFQSREGIYFRLDRILPEGSADATGGRYSRLVVRPEGFALMRGIEEESMAVIAFGPSSEGTSRLYSERVFEADRRGYFEYMRDFFKQCQKLGSYQATNDEFGVKIVHTLDDSTSSEDREYEYTYQLDRDTFKMKRWEERLLEQGRCIASRVVEKTYGVYPIPMKISVSDSPSPGTGNSSEKTVLLTTRFDNQPAPLANFAISAIDSVQAVKTGVWTRRVITLSVGAMLLSLYVWFRNRLDRMPQASGR
jgi:hypothetical protein